MAECRGAVVTAFHEPLEVRNLPIPELEPGAMLARVDAATLCGTDVHIWHGQMAGTEDKLPYIPGHETCGTIVEMRGDRTDHVGRPLKVGERVIWTYTRCGHCYYCTVANQPTLCGGSIKYGRARADQAPYLLGGCAEYHYIPPGASVIPVPETVSAPLAASAACALRTVMHGFERLGGLAAHETVVVQGCGPVGLYAMAVARDRGANKVLAIGAPAARLRVARDWGADATLDLDEYGDVAARREWVLDQTGGRGSDVVIQCAGALAVPEALDFVRPGGRVLSIGAGGNKLTVPGTALTTKQLTLFGVLQAETRHFYQAIEFLATRKERFPFERMISGTYPLERLTEALQAMAEFREVKPVVIPAHA